MEKVKMHCAAKIVEARRTIEDKAEEDTKASIAKFEEKYESLREEVKEKVSSIIKLISSE